MLFLLNSLCTHNYINSVTNESAALIDWLINWLMNWMIDWLIDWLIEWLIPLQELICWVTCWTTWTATPPSPSPRETLFVICLCGGRGGFKTTLTATTFVQCPSPQGWNKWPNVSTARLIRDPQMWPEADFWEWFYRCIKLLYAKCQKYFRKTKEDRSQKTVTNDGPFLALQ